MDPEIETLDRRTLTEPDARAVAELVCAVWPKPGRTVERWAAGLLEGWRDYAGPEAMFPRLFVVREEGRVIALASAHPRTIGTSLGNMTVMALARVCTAPAARGRRLGQAVVQEAFNLVDHGPYRFSLFQTSDSVRTFYERLGAVAVDNRFSNSLGQDPSANPFWSEVVMRYPSGSGWPEGEIDLRGPGW